MKTTKTILAALILGLSVQSVLAGPPVLVNRQTGEYLGTLSNNKYDPDSTSNPYGEHGSKYGNTINNPYSQYGSKYSNDSPNNPYATNAPAIIAPGASGLPTFNFK